MLSFITSKILVFPSMVLELPFAYSLLYQKIHMKKSQASQFTHYQVHFKGSELWVTVLISVASNLNLNTSLSFMIGNE